MKIAKRISMWVAVVAVLAAIGGSVAASTWNMLKKKGLVPDGEISEKISWRARLFARKATGGIPDLSWGELWSMASHKGGFGLERLALGVTAEGSLVNPYDTLDDREAGARIFGQRCARCHGIDGVGGGAPPLNHPGLKHGDSNLSIYKVLRDGIPGTPMVSPGLPTLERWQVIGYITNLMIHGTGANVDNRMRLNINVSSDRILSAGTKSDEWLTYSGSLDGHRYTPLAQITPANVSQLRVQWTQQFYSEDPFVEATPLVVDGAIFITEPPSNAVAVNAKTGEIIWRYDRKVPGDLSLCCGRSNRGLAILGHTVFLVTLDDYLVALNANTGEKIWETKVADDADGYTLTGAPLIVNQSVVVGVSGGEFGIRGFLASYDAVTGEQQWKFNTIPAPGEAGHETWKSDGWKTGGAPTWVTGSYDKSLDLLYWGVGNAASDYSGDNRPGDNLYTDSVIALHPSTGKLAWYFQFTPHDEHDWDSTQTPILTDISLKGKLRKVLAWPNRNGFYYVLDRETGEFLNGVPFVEQNWAKGLDPRGRPILVDDYEASPKGRLTKPSDAGGTNWQNSAIDQIKGLVFAQLMEGATVYTKALKVSPREIDRKLFLSSAAYTSQRPDVVVRALDVVTGTKKWEHLSPPIDKEKAYSYSGLLATGGGLLFGGSGGYEYALDSSTGREVWRVNLGGDIRAAPISFTLDGKQVIVVSAGRALFLFGL